MLTIQQLRRILDVLCTGFAAVVCVAEEFVTLEAVPSSSWITLEHANTLEPSPGHASRVCATRDVYLCVLLCQHVGGGSLGVGRVQADAWPVANALGRAVFCYVLHDKAIAD